MSPNHRPSRVAALLRWFGDLKTSNVGACATRADGATVHRTSMLRDVDGQVVGRICGCRLVLLTAAGHPAPRPLPDATPSKAHLARIGAAS